MRRSHFEAFAPVCPTCRQIEFGVLTGHAHPLVLGEVHEERDGHILHGIVRCTNPQCQREYPILDGVPLLIANIRTYIQSNLLGLVMRDDLSPAMASVIGDCTGAGSSYDVHRQHLSHYISDHWADLDPGLPPEEREAAGGVRRLLDAGLSLIGDVPDGLRLDMGCSLGRSTFELAAQGEDLVLGIDLNFSMLKVAARILREGRLSYDRRRVGVVYDRREYDVSVPGADKVDFWHCDVMALPFAPKSLALATSVNLLDCVASPTNHLHSLSELLMPEGRAIVASPFDWSNNATEMEHWLGGHSQRAQHQGASEQVIRQWLPAVSLQLLGEVPEVPWAVRLHARSTMHYRSYVMALGPG